MMTIVYEYEYGVLDLNIFQSYVHNKPFMLFAGWGCPHGETVYDDTTIGNLTTKPEVFTSEGKEVPDEGIEFFVEPEKDTFTPMTINGSVEGTAKIQILNEAGEVIYDNVSEPIMIIGIP